MKTWLARGLFLADLDSEAYAILDPLPVTRENPLAATLLGLLLRGESTEIPEDLPRSLELLTVAADAYFAPGQYYFGGSYDNGYGVTQDHFEAASWYSRAADQNYPKAKAALGSMYMRGEGVAFDEAGGLDS